MVQNIREKTSNVSKLKNPQKKVDEHDPNDDKVS